MPTMTHRAYFPANRPMTPQCVGILDHRPPRKPYKTPGTSPNPLDFWTVAHPKNLLENPT